MLYMLLNVLNRIKNLHIYMLLRSFDMLIPSIDFVFEKKEEKIALRLIRI